jgi:hypothetical protein
MIRQLTDQDSERVQEIFRAQGLAYALPRVSDFIEALAVDDNGLQAALAARPTVEMYLLCDPKWGTPGMRAMSLRLLQRGMSARLRARGIQDQHMWIPPQLASFTKRLIRDEGWELLGPEWPCLTRSTSIHG